jgi:hypothetical protein
MDTIYERNRAKLIEALNPDQNSIRKVINQLPSFDFLEGVLKEYLNVKSHYFSPSKLTLERKSSNQGDYFELYGCSETNNSYSRSVYATVDDNGNILQRGEQRVYIHSHPRLFITSQVFFNEGIKFQILSPECTITFEDGIPLFFDKDDTVFDEKNAPEYMIDLLNIVKSSTYLTGNTHFYDSVIN